MLIASLQVELLLHATFSLKEKRFVLRSIKAKIKKDFNVSIAEVDYLDKWQRSVLGIACVSNDRRFLDTVLSKIINAIDKDNRIEIVNQVVDIY
ncbi:DUF503 domain-containing protein [bacterium]|nr:DUF503 domain-containing protein [bacterium]